MKRLPTRTKIGRTQEIVTNGMSDGGKPTNKITVPSNHVAKKLKISYGMIQGAVRKGELIVAQEGRYRMINLSDDATLTMLAALKRRGYRHHLDRADAILDRLEEIRHDFE